MKSLINPTLFTLSALLLAGAAGAQSAPAAAPVAAAPAMEDHHGRHGAHHGDHAAMARMTPEQRQARMAERHAARMAHRAQRQAELHARLHLTPAQEPAWNAFVAATAPVARQPGDFQQRRAELAAMTLPQRAELRLQWMAQRQQRMAAHVAALKTFYAALTPEQQKILEESLRHGRRHHRMD